MELTNIGNTWSIWENSSWKPSVTAWECISSDKWGTLQTIRSLKMFMRFGMHENAVVISPHSCTPNSQPFIDKSYVSWVSHVFLIWQFSNPWVNHDFPEDICEKLAIGERMAPPCLRCQDMAIPCIHSPIKSHSIPAFKNLQTPLLDHLNPIYLSKVPMLPGHFFGSKVNRTNSWWI